MDIKYRNILRAGMYSSRISSSSTYDLLLVTSSLINPSAVNSLSLFRDNSGNFRAGASHSSRTVFRVNTVTVIVHSGKSQSFHSFLFSFYSLPEIKFPFFFILMKRYI